MEVFKIQDLTYSYPEAKEPALQGIDLHINEGDFILLLGKSGSGKSTLGRVFNGIIPDFYGGKISGTIEGTRDVGMVFQDPEKQLVMDHVEREIAFGLENIGSSYPLMRKRVMEALSFLNLTDIKNQKTYELSGGQKQKVAIGTALAMGSRLLVLDEPTSQLDPTSADEILHVVEKLNKELGYTIILIEQRIDRCFHMADRILFMDSGRLVFNDTPQKFIYWSREHCLNFLPSISRLFTTWGYKNIPMTIKDGRAELKKIIDLSNRISEKPISEQEEGDTVLQAEDIHFTYNNGIKALKGLSLVVKKGQILGVMGQNGSGKSTLLKAICGLIKSMKGKMIISGDVGYLSQNPNDYLFNDTVYEELKFTLKNKNIKDYSKIDEILKQLYLSAVRDINPRDLSGGEKQRVALASVLVAEPDIILLDEPTRGMDRELKDALGETIERLHKQGKTIIVVTHDVEFVAKYCTKVCLLFDGTVVQIGNCHEVFSSGIYYTTQMNKLFNGYLENILTLEDALNALEPEVG